MEADTAVQTTVSSLVQLGKIRLPLVVHAMVGALEGLSKVRYSL